MQLPKKKNKKELQLNKNLNQRQYKRIFQILLLKLKMLEKQNNGLTKILLEIPTQTLLNYNILPSINLVQDSNLVWMDSIITLIKTIQSLVRLFSLIYG